MAWRSSSRPWLAVYAVAPWSRASMEASRMCQGVTKSGSPMLRLMTSLRVLTISKKSRIPERGMFRMCGVTKDLRADLDPLMGGFREHQDPLVLVGFQHEV